MRRARASNARAAVAHSALAPSPPAPCLAADRPPLPPHRRSNNTLPGQSSVSAGIGPVSGGESRSIHRVRDLAGGVFEDDRRPAGRRTSARPGRQIASVRSVDPGRRIPTTGQAAAAVEAHFQIGAGGGGKTARHQPQLDRACIAGCSWASIGETSKQRASSSLLRCGSQGSQASAACRAVGRNCPTRPVPAPDRRSPPHRPWSAASRPGSWNSDRRPDRRTESVSSTLPLASIRAPLPGAVGRFMPDGERGQGSGRRRGAGNPAAGANARSAPAARSIKGRGLVPSPIPGAVSQGCCGWTAA